MHIHTPINSFINMNIQMCFRILLVIFFSMLLVSCNRNIYPTKLPLTDCKELLKHYSSYWVKDSLGLNGFRVLLAAEFLSSCNFKDSKWSDIAHLMGQANVIRITENKTHLRYKLNGIQNKPEQFGNYILEIFVKDDIITTFFVRLVDG